MSAIWTPFPVVYDVSDEFLRHLRNIDPTLLVSWNPRRERHQIEQCIGRCQGKMESGIFKHFHTCDRIFVWLVESEDGTRLPLGDKVLDKLKSMDTSRKYGVGPDALAKYQKDSAEEERKRAEKIAADTREIARLSTKDNKRQFKRVIDLIRRHDVYRPNK